MSGTVNMEDAFLSMPWGTRHYRFSDIDATKYPHNVEVEEDNGSVKEWVKCPNVNVALRIQRMLKI